ncbi:hypothetical protein BDV25DRAFT_149610 [Aspergillus avenaceus]|uniref:Uncharacterized protein n=1 Tax=Aspergillus avenaceus TaxID=36643 RepID=A0A5N6U3Y9_ASPAV|nr:hypothetical protein BDV25DRAFT_149610 [Aspergillus avenaceus]
MNLSFTAFNDGNAWGSWFFRPSFCVRALLFLGLVVMGFMTLTHGVGPWYRV